jgi:hypothetical protein
MAREQQLGRQQRTIRSAQDKNLVGGMHAKPLLGADFVIWEIDSQFKNQNSTIRRAATSTGFLTGIRQKFSGLT